MRLKVTMIWKAPDPSLSSMTMLRDAEGSEFGMMELLARYTCVLPA